jgi:hypothetical protein
MIIEFIHIQFAKKMSEMIERHLSKFGIASCLIGVLNWSYAGFLVFDVRDGHKGFINYLLGDGPILGLIVFPVFFLIIPMIGNVLGFLVGIVALFQTECKRTFSFLGLVMNAIIPSIFLIGFVWLVVRNGELR